MKHAVPKPQIKFAIINQVITHANCTESSLHRKVSLKFAQTTWTLHKNDFATFGRQTERVSESCTQELLLKDWHMAWSHWYMVTVLSWLMAPWYVMICLCLWVSLAWESWDGLLRLVPMQESIYKSSHACCDCRRGKVKLLRSAFVMVEIDWFFVVLHIVLLGFLVNPATATVLKARARSLHNFFGP